MTTAIAGQCEDVTGEWNGLCPSCHQRLPAKRPFRSGRDDLDAIYRVRHPERYKPRHETDD